MGDIESIEKRLKTLKNQAQNFPERTRNVITKIIQEIEILLLDLILPLDLIIHPIRTEIQQIASLLKELYWQNYSENQFDYLIVTQLILNLYELVRFCLRDDCGKFGADASSQKDNEIIRLISFIISFIDIDYIHNHGFINPKDKKILRLFYGYLNQLTEQPGNQNLKQKIKTNLNNRIELRLPPFDGILVKNSKNNLPGQAKLAI